MNPRRSPFPDPQTYDSEALAELGAACSFAGRLLEACEAYELALIFAPMRFDRPQAVRVQALRHRLEDVERQLSDRRPFDLRVEPRYPRGTVFEPQPFFQGEPLEVSITLRDPKAPLGALPGQLGASPADPESPGPLPAPPGRFWWDYLSIRLFRRAASGWEEVCPGSPASRWLPPHYQDPEQRAKYGDRAPCASDGHASAAFPPEVSAALLPGACVVLVTYDTTAERDPRVWHGRLHAGTVEITLEPPGDDAARARVLVRRSEHAGTWGRDDQAALALAEEATRVAPQEPDPWLRLGHALQAAGELAGAITAYERTIRLEQSRPRSGCDMRLSALRMQISDLRAKLGRKPKPATGAPILAADPTGTVTLVISGAPHGMLDPNAYLQGEPIPFDLRLSLAHAPAPGTLASAGLTLAPPNGSWLDFLTLRFERQSGDGWASALAEFDWRAARHRPGHVAEGNVIVQGGAGPALYFHLPPEATEALPPGEYRLSAVFDNTTAPGDRLWRGRIEAGPLTFRARAPQGTEDRSAVLAAQSLWGAPPWSLAMARAALELGPGSLAAWELLGRAFGRGGDEAAELDVLEQALAWAEAVPDRTEDPRYWTLRGRDGSLRHRLGKPPRDSPVDP